MIGVSNSQGSAALPNFGRAAPFPRPGHLLPAVRNGRTGEVKKLTRNRNLLTSAFKGHQLWLGLRVVKNR